MHVNLKNRTGAKLTASALLLVLSATVSGCHVDMWRQQKMRPWYESDFFADRQAMRPLVPGTVPRGPDTTLRTDDPAYFTGYEPTGALTRGIPRKAVQAFASPKEMLLRGQDRYGAFCTPCHGKTGDGNGFIMQRGLGNWQKLAASYHSQRLREVEDGHIYNTIVNGYGVMYGYATRIQDVNDRWAVVAYVRALQLAREQSGSTVGAPQTGAQPAIGTGGRAQSVPGSQTEPALSPNPNNETQPSPLTPGGIPVERPANRTPGGPSPEGERRPPQPAGETMPTNEGAGR
jgi:cytochrome c553